MSETKGDKIIKRKLTVNPDGTYKAIIGDDANTYAGKFSNATQDVYLGTNLNAAYIAGVDSIYSIMDGSNVIYAESASASIMAGNLTTTLATGNTIDRVLALHRKDTNAASAGIGTGLGYYIDDTTGHFLQASIDVSMLDVGAGTEQSIMEFYVRNAGSPVRAIALDYSGILDATNVLSMDPANRILYASDGVTPMLNYGTPLNLQTVSYQLVLTDGGKTVTMYDDANPMTLIVPDNATTAFAIGTQVDIIQTGLQTVVVTPLNGSVTINSKGGNLSTAAQFVAVSLIKLDTDTWILIGDLA